LFRGLWLRRPLYQSYTSANAGGCQRFSLSMGNKRCVGTGHSLDSMLGRMDRVPIDGNDSDLSESGCQNCDSISEGMVGGIEIGVRCNRILQGNRIRQGNPLLQGSLIHHIEGNPIQGSLMRRVRGHQTIHHIDLDRADRTKRSPTDI